MKSVLLLVLVAYRAKCMESVYMKRAEIEDQESSASGYAYHLNSGGPLAYAAYPLGGGIASVGGLGNQLVYPQELPLQLPEYKPHAPVGVVGLGPLNHFGLQAHPYALNHPLQAHAFRPIAAPIPAPIPVPVAVSNSESFEKGGGSKYADANQQSHGEKGSTGYKSAQEYEKGAQGQHDNKGHKEFYSQQGGQKAGHHDQAAHYGQKEEAAKGSQGSHFNEQKSHKKGSKTTGFHKVHHKDEYKKDHSFYDESDASGHFSKHGDYDSQHSQEKGGFQKGGHNNKGYQEGEKGLKGFEDKGHHNGQNSGFKGEEGKQAYHKNFQEYGKKGGEQEGQEYGFNKKEGFQGVQ